MKGGNAMIFATLKALDDLGLLEDRTITVYFTGDEENSCMPNWVSIGEVFYESNWNANYLENRNFHINFGQINLSVIYFFGKKALDHVYLISFMLYLAYSVFVWREFENSLRKQSNIFYL